MQLHSRNTISISIFTIIIILLSVTTLNAQIPTNNMVAYYPFNSNADDGSGNGYNGIVYSASLAADRFGNENSAYNFNGIDSYIDLGDILDNVFCADTAQFTISGWAKTRVYNIVEGNLIIGKTAGGSGPYQWSMSHNNGMFFGGVFSDSTTQNYQQKYINTGTDQWFHFVLIFDGKQSVNDRIRIYVNNSSNMYNWNSAGTLGTSTKNTSLHLYIGGQNHFSSPHNIYDGLIDDIRIYNRLLTQAEIGALYHENGWNTIHIVPTITSFTPTRNALNVSENTNITITFNTDIDQSTLNNSTIKINSSLNGLHSSALSYNSSTYTATITPNTSFKVGEIVTVTLTRGIKSITGDSLTSSSSWQYTIKTNTTSATFTQTSTPGTGSYPTSVTGGDFNKDGYLDLAVVNSYSETVTTLINNGSGQFTDTSTTVVGSMPWTVISGDWNNDEYQDLAVTNKNSNTISILINNGNSQFTQTSIVVVGDLPYSLTSGDWNCDGYQDLAVANWNSNTVTILLNDGSAQFTQTSTPMVGTSPQSIISGDWNGDGYPDLAVTNWNANTISILINNGSGQFTQISTPGVGNAPHSITSGDWNSDGYLDLAVTNFAEDTVSILMNNSSGQFTLSSTSGVGSNPMSIASGDWNGDGYLDLAVTNIGASSNSVSILINNGSGQFAQTSVPSVGIEPNSVTLGDWNGDGYLDLATANYISNTVSILMNGASTNSLVAYYPFNGNANDESGNGHNATYINGTLTADRFGKNNSAYNFNGTSNTIQCGDILDEVFCAPIAKFTITGWANTRTCGNYTTGGGMIMSKSSGGGGIYQWNITHQENLINVAVISDGIAQNYLWLTNPMPTNQWFQFALVFDGSLPEMQRVKLYVNGQSSNTSVYKHQGTLGTTTQNSTQNVCIGASHEFGNPQALHTFYDGTVDDIRIYSIPLTQIEIDSLYKEGGWNTNRAPLANAGPDQTIYADSTSGILVNLDASLSSDIDKDTLTYIWKESDTLLTTGINPSILLSLGTHNITLFVDDAKGGLDTDLVVITICNSSEGLAAYYPFNGNANDESGNGYNATFISATPVFDRFGKDSSAFYFNGIDNYIDFGDILDNVFCKDTAQFSISGWAKTEVMGNVNGEGNIIIGKTAGGTGPYQWSVSHNTGMLFGGAFSDSTVNNFQHKYIPMDANNWFHFVLIFDGKQSEENRMRIIVNNNSDMHYWSGQGTLGTSTKNTSLHMYAGGQTHYFQTLQNRYNGIIDDIRIYNRVLSSGEIKTLYLEGDWDTTNHAPVADAGPDQTIYMDDSSSALVTLDGSASSDTDEDVLTYTWKLADTTLATGVKPIVQLPLGNHTVTLVVVDGRGGIDMDQVVISVYSQLKVKTIFTLDVGGPIYAGISVLGDNAIYAIASGDAVYRINAAGSVAYTIQVAGDIRSSSSIAYDTTIYIASSDRNLYAFSKDGNSLWPPLPTGGSLTATPTIDSIANRIYIGVSNHNFIAVNRLTGAVAWNYFADDQIWNSAVITSDRKLIFATQKGTLYGFDLNNLTLPATPSWQIALPDAAPGSIALDNHGYIYIGTSAGRLLKISMPANQQPSIVWQVQIGEAIIGSPVIDAAGTLYVGSIDANLYAVDIESGAVKWTFSTDGAIRSTPAISDAGNIYFANDNGEIISLDASKNILWYYKISSAIVAPLMYYNSTLYVGTLGNQVIALSDVIDSSQTPIMLKSDASYKITGKPIWATFQGNNQRTGMLSLSSSGTTGIGHSSNNLPTSYTLAQNYPNPFNPSTKIQFALPNEGKVSIIIFNILGKQIATLVDGFQHAGYHEVIFNMDSYSSGIYFYQMRAGAFFETKKMILMK